MRCFVAISLPDEICAALEDVQAELRVGVLMDPETFHVTLAFLDDQPDHAIAALHDCLGDLRAAPIDLSVRGVDVFGGAKPRLIWAGIEPNAPLTDLRQMVRRSAQESDIALRREKFRPHITLARLRGQMRGDEPEKLARFLGKHATTDFGRFQATEFKLYRSTLHASGAVHEVLATYSLQ